MKKLIFIAVFALGWVACNQNLRPVVIDRRAYKLPDPPGATWVGPNLFIEQHERTNLEYIEYLTWLEETKGERSAAYQAAVPVYFKDTRLPYAEDYQSYMRDRTFDQYPVVGITREQAAAFAVWKTDRVNELILLERGILAGDNIEFSFSENFQIGGPHTKYADSDPMPMVRYRLPTLNEWKQAVNRTGEAGRSAYGTGPVNDLFACNQSPQLSAGSLLTLPAVPGIGKSRVPQYLQGNVAEWLTEGRTPAGLWLAEVDGGDATANLKTGFRLVVEYVLKDANWLQSLSDAGPNLPD